MDEAGNIYDTDFNLIGQANDDDEWSLLYDAKIIYYIYSLVEIVRVVWKI